ncbi:MAG: NCS2 family permease [Gammaproteobacteria bacterium]|nr:NCS2 family permease [Acidimicrobiia bacterium]MYC59269.1 NCS2 family permease [Gammaproteobacteria bacterium]
MIDRVFRLDEHGTTASREIAAGVTTYLAMAYIAIVNPQILADAGMDQGAVFVATCLATAIACAAMGLYANYPIALAPGMGINAFFTYGVVLGMGHPWQTALGALFISGVCFVLISVLPIRTWIINAFPRSLKLATAAGIGFFLAIIAMRNAGIVVGDETTLVSLGDVSFWSVVLAVVGLILIAALDALKKTGAILIGMLAVTAAGLLVGEVNWQGTVSAVPSLAPTFLQLDIGAAFDMVFFGVIFAFLFTDLFDTSGTLIAVARQGELLDDEGNLPRLKQAVIVDSGASMLGSLLGTSSVTSYVESAAGVKAGGRTGLSAVTVAVLFLLTLFLSPLAATIPPFATAAALLFVACVMIRNMTGIDWDDATEYVPAVVLAMTIPFSFSIANGIAAGFITYAAIKLVSGRFRQLKPAVGTLAVLFVAKIAFLGA